VVAYCVEAEATIAATRGWGYQVIAGNCEEPLAAGAGDCGCDFETGTECDRLAKAGYEFGRDRISTGNRTWLHSLPKTLRFTLGGLKYRVVHGGIDLIDRFVFRSDREVIADELERGMPMLSSPTAGCGSIPELSVCPRMMAPPILGLGWSSAGVITLCCQSHRLSYDHNGATAARRKWGHANGYAHCPTTGLWPSLDVLPAEERKATAVIVHAHTLEIHSPSMPTILAR